MNELFFPYHVDVEFFMYMYVCYAWMLNFFIYVGYVCIEFCILAVLRHISLVFVVCKSCTIILLLHDCF